MQYRDALKYINEEALFILTQRRLFLAQALEQSTALTICIDTLHRHTRKRELLIGTKANKLEQE